MKIIRFDGRVPSVDHIKVGNEMDNLAESVRFDLPEWSDAVVSLYISNGKYSDVIMLDADRTYRPTRVHTQRPGRWTAYLTAQMDGDVVWHSDTFGLVIGNLPPTGEQIEQAYPTAIEEAMRAVDTLTGVGARAVTLEPGSDATVSFEEDVSGNRVIVYGIPRGADGSGGAGGGGSDGATFTPSVSDEGVISWTNDKDLPNPDPVDIKGDPGAVFTPSVSSEGVLSWSNNGGLSNPESVSIRGPQGMPGADGKDGTDGKDGATGADGQDGTTPTIGDNGNWYIGDTDTGKPSRGEIGPAGADGKSAYAYAMEGGYTGTEEAFAVKLASDIPAVDSTLTQPGQAADAKTVGDALSNISEELANLQTSGLTTEQVNALNGLFKIVAYTADPTSAYSAFKVAFGLDGGGTGVTLSSISATYSGGDVAVGTALSALTGIMVTATYSDGSTATVTGYTLSGEIAEGSNTITVTYQDKTTTFSVTGTAVSQVYTVTNNLTNVTTSNAATSVEAGGSYNATLTVDDGCELASLTITMGGVDITDDVYGDGYILITDVTGDIVITAAAAVPQYVDIATGISTDTVKLYSDSGSTAIATKYYQKGAYSLNRTETDAVVKVRLTNNTDSDISSSNVYIGSTDAQAIRNPNSSINVHYAISGSKGSVAAGASVEIEYTVRAGYWLYVCGYGSLDVSVVGALDVHEPTDVLATTSKLIDSFSVYSDAGTTLVDKGTYKTAYATTEAFDVDTPIRLTVVSGGANSGNILYGCTQSGTLTANVNAHYGATDAVRNFATGAALIIDYTVKAGYYFAVLPSAGATIYIEKV